MLVHLQIRDFAIIEQLELNLSGGMNAITGETGAGKSILVDALGLLLGDRADSNSIIRQTAERAEISAVFDIAQLTDARNWLAQHDLDHVPEHGLAPTNHECHLRRVISRNGRSRNYINGSLQPLQSMKELGEFLVDILSQHAHQSLLQRRLQRQLLDDYAANQKLLTTTAQAYQHWNQLRQHIETLKQNDAERSARLDLLRYHIEELQSLALQDNELALLEEEHSRLTNADRLLERSQEALQGLYENEELAAYAIISKISADMSALGSIDNRLLPIQELLNAALVQLEEASDGLRHYGQGLEPDPNRLAWLEQRLDTIHTLARKHRCPATDLVNFLATLQHEFEQLDNSEQRLDQLEQELKRAAAAYQKRAKQLSTRRAKAAQALSTSVSAAMQHLGMADGRFQVRLSALDQPTANGLDGIEFLVSANPGQTPQSLNKVASGGELSRISLAIQVTAASTTHIPILIFDEVDSGIGGGVAEVVGRQLRQLAENRQVLCITHLAQVAAQAQHHHQVSKHANNQHTRTVVTALNDKQRVNEIARMLGGLKLTAKTLTHAREMISQAKEVSL